MNRNAHSSFVRKLDLIATYDKRHLLYDRPFIQTYVNLSAKEDFSSQAKSITRQGEELANAVYKKFDGFIDGIESFNFIKYPNAYNQATWGRHDGCYSPISISNAKNANIQREKNIAKALFNIGKCSCENVLLAKQALLHNIGEIKDYETPLNYASSRNIDLISVRAGKLYILELKKRNSRETLLRCLLESYTYSRLADRSRLKESFGLGQNAPICICPLIFDDSAAFQELTAITKNAKSKEGSSLFKLVKRICEYEGEHFDVRFAVIETKRFIQALRSDRKGKAFDLAWLQ